MIILKFDYNKIIKKIIYHDKKYTYELIRSIVSRFYNINENFKLLINSEIEMNNITDLKNYIDNLYLNNTVLIRVIKLSSCVVSENESTSKSWISVDNSNFLISNNKFNYILNDSCLVESSIKDTRYRLILHKNIICNHCNKVNIRGIRFKCTICNNFNLCEDCEELDNDINHDSNHIMIRIIENINNYNFENLNSRNKKKNWYNYEKHFNKGEPYTDILKGSRNRIKKPSKKFHKFYNINKDNKHDVYDNKENIE